VKRKRKPQSLLLGLSYDFCMGFAVGLTFMGVFCITLELISRLFK